MFLPYATIGWEINYYCRVRLLYVKGFILMLRDTKIDMFHLSPLSCPLHNETQDSSNIRVCAVLM